MHTATLDIPSLPTASSQAHILSGLAKKSLLYVGKMCNSGCAIVFTARKVTVKHGEATILTVTLEKDSFPLEKLPQAKTSLSTQRTMYMKKVYPRRN
jgi:hypothetical protein